MNNKNKMVEKLLNDSFLISQRKCMPAKILEPMTFYLLSGRTKYHVTEDATCSFISLVERSSSGNK